MNDSTGDREIVGRLQALYAAELDRAAADILGAPILGTAKASVRWRGLASVVSTLAVAGALILAVALRSSLGAGPQAGGVPTQGPSTAAATGSTTSTPPTSFQQKGGMPTTIGGEPVLTGTAITNAIGTSTDDTPFLVGGWLHVEQPQLYCPMVLTNHSPWTICDALPLYGSADESEPLWIYPGQPSKLGDLSPHQATRPVVLRIHTHDPACPTGYIADCSRLPVFIEVVWAGPGS
jgi:hypothetical protein